ncbi:MAG TPA: PIN domain-containing protein [Tepidisphaeraceae bacterium]|nr:PIN domain-containing protein [Tepidisphaeraceae bacterium]
MTLIDTSVLITYLKTASPAIRAIFGSVECAICGVTRAEVLHGARTKQDAISLNAALNAFIQLPIQQSIWGDLGNHLASLRLKGLPMPFQDVLIAAVAIDQKAELWSYDSHFQLIQSALPELRLFDGPKA